MTPADSTRRVILTATCFAEAEAMLALAEGLAAEAGAMLQGVLVEDADSVALAVAGAARIVDPAGRPVAGLDPARMGAAYARDAARFERMLAEAATRTALTWGFRRARGRLAGALTGLAAPGDLLVLPAGLLRSPLREIVLAAGADPDLAPLAAAAAARIRRPLRQLAAPTVAGAPWTGLGPGSVLFSHVEAHNLAALLGATRCIHVLRA